MKNICFFYQVWYDDKRSIYESLKRLRKFHPDDELIVVIAGLKQDEINEYYKTYAQKIETLFNISCIDYITMEEFPGMAGNGKDLKCLDTNYRDTWFNFSELWLDRMVKLPSENVDILMACSDDWMVLEKIPFNNNVDVNGLISDISVWMNGDAMKSNFSYKLNPSKFIWWPAAGCYMNFKKFKQGYNETNKKYIKNFVETTYAPTLGMYLDFICGLWAVHLFDSFSTSDHILQYNARDHIITKYGGIIDKDIQTVDEYPEEIYERKTQEKVSCISIHSYKTFKNMPVSDEMINLNILETEYSSPWVFERLEPYVFNTNYKIK